MKVEIGDFVWASLEGDLEDEPYWSGIFIGQNTILLEAGTKLSNIKIEVVIPDKDLRKSERKFVEHWRKQNTNA